MKPTKDSVVIKVQPWGKDQGDFVNIYEDDFNPKFHKKFVAKKVAKKKANKK